MVAKSEASVVIIKPTKVEKDDRVIFNSSISSSKKLVTRRIVEKQKKYGNNNENHKKKYHFARKKKLKTRNFRKFESHKNFDSHEVAHTYGLVPH